MNITELVQVAHEDADINGWHDDLPTEAGARNAWIGNKMLLIVSEVVEAHDEIRNGQDVNKTILDHKGKPLGVPSELADVVIRVADLCGVLQIDLEGIIRRKLEYNRSRGYKHGGKQF